MLLFPVLRTEASCCSTLSLVIDDLQFVVVPHFLNVILGEYDLVDLRRPSEDTDFPVVVLTHCREDEFSVGRDMAEFGFVVLEVRFVRQFEAMYCCVIVPISNLEVWGFSGTVFW